jgi:hypothetical protein
MGHPSTAAYEIVVMCLTTDSEEDRTLPESRRFLDAVREMHVKRTLGR